MKKILDTYKGKKIFITGHTGFKGAWMSCFLAYLGADVVGYSLEPPTQPSLFDVSKMKNHVESLIGDIRDYERLSKAMQRVKPDIVFHLAAQPIVREGYMYPRYTYETNVMGTVNILDAIRNIDNIRSVLNVTTDKVYKNFEIERGYREDEPLDGSDPYSNSKSCSELVTHSYKQSFFCNTGVSISTARAGNVIGGGDFAKFRIIPDCIRAAMNEEDMIIRNPHSIRPYQHVLEPVFAYLMIAAEQYNNPKVADYYNVGPDESECVTTEMLVKIFAKYWGHEFKWSIRNDGGPPEANFLKLDNSKLKQVFNWSPKWNIDMTIDKTVEWTKEWINNKDIRVCMEKQIEMYLGEFNE